MEQVKLLDKFTGVLQKYKYAFLVLILGIVLMTIPNLQKGKVAQETKIPQTTTMDATESLTQILSQIHGAGKVRLLLTLDAGEKTQYQTDSSGQEGDCDTVIITDDNRAQQGLVQQIHAPTYRGAVVVCQGADNPAVKLAIIQAVSSATGLSSDHICVLKMK